MGKLPLKNFYYHIRRQKYKNLIIIGWIKLCKRCLQNAKGILRRKENTKNSWGVRNLQRRGNITADY